MDKQPALNIEEAEQVVSAIEKKCKIADHCYELSTADAAKLLEIIEVFGKETDRRENLEPALKAKNIFINVIDRNIACLVKEFLDRRPKLDPFIENTLSSAIMRMAGH